MGFFNEPVRTELAANARPALLHLMRNHRRGHGDPLALVEVVDAYLRLNPRDEEVREACKRLGGAGESVST